MGLFAPNAEDARNRTMTAVCTNSSLEMCFINVPHLAAAVFTVLVATRPIQKLIATDAVAGTAASFHFLVKLWACRCHHDIGPCTAQPCQLKRSVSKKACLA